MDHTYANRKRFWIVVVAHDGRYGYKAGRLSTRSAYKKVVSEQENREQFRCLKPSWHESNSYWRIYQRFKLVLSMSFTSHTTLMCRRTSHTLSHTPRTDVNTTGIIHPHMPTESLFKIQILYMNDLFVAAATLRLHWNDECPGEAWREAASWSQSHTLREVIDNRFKYSHLRSRTVALRAIDLPTWLARPTEL